MTKVKLKGAAALLFGMFLAVLASDGPIGRTVEVEGHVYCARGSSGVPIDAVEGAVISTSLETTTAVTNRSGHVHLRTRARVAGDEFYIITVQAGDLVWRQRTMSANMTGQQFVLEDQNQVRAAAAGEPHFVRPSKLGSHE